MIDKLLSLRQTGRAQVYANQFLDYRQYVSWDDKYAIYHFNRGLKDELRHDLKMFAEPSTLLEWIKVVVNMDDKNYAINSDIRRREHKDPKKTDSKPNKSSSRSAQRANNGASTSYSSNYVPTNTSAPWTSAFRWRSTPSSTARSRPRSGNVGSAKGFAYTVERANISLSSALTSPTRPRRALHLKKIPPRRREKPSRELSRPRALGLTRDSGARTGSSFSVPRPAQ